MFLSRIGTFNASNRMETIVLIKVPRYFYLIPCHTSLLQFPLNIRTLKIIFSLLIFSSFFSTFFDTEIPELSSVLQ